MTDSIMVITFYLAACKREIPLAGFNG